MKKLSQLLAVAGFASALLLSTNNVLAQNNPPPDGGRGDRGGRGGFDPAEMQKRMLERVKEQLEVTKDDEWAVLQPIVQKVFDARREQMAEGMGGMMRGFSRSRGGGDNNNGGGGSGDQNRRPSFFGERSAESQALDKAIESKASKKDLEAAMAKVRAAKKAKEAKVKEAQDNLRKVLSTRQEAIAVANGWLD